MKKQLFILSTLFITISTQCTFNSLQNLIQQNASELINKAKAAAFNAASVTLAKAQEEAKKAAATAATFAKAQEEGRKVVDAAIVKVQKESEMLARSTAEAIMAKAQSLIDNAADSLTLKEKLNNV